MKVRICRRQSHGGGGHRAKTYKGTWPKQQQESKKEKKTKGKKEMGPKDVALAPLLFSLIPGQIRIAPGESSDILNICDISAFPSTHRIPNSEHRFSHEQHPTLPSAPRTLTRIGHIFIPASHKLDSCEQLKVGRDRKSISSWKTKTYVAPSSMLSTLQYH
jgi:hypothetical protein